VILCLGGGRMHEKNHAEASCGCDLMNQHLSLSRGTEEQRGSRSERQA
jgi:hypothetical protein